MTQILTQNRKFRYGRGSTKGKIPFEYPYRTAPNGRFSAEKTPRPILLSSRSGVRVPPGVPILWCGEDSKIKIQQSGGLLIARLLPSNSLILRVPPGVPIFGCRSCSNIIWWVSPSGLRPRIVVPVFVGSNPITHPIKREDTSWYPLFLYGYLWVMGFERGDPA